MISYESGLIWKSQQKPAFEIETFDFSKMRENMTSEHWLFKQLLWNRPMAHYYRFYSHIVALLAKFLRTN